MFGGTTLYSADAFEVKELNLRVLMLLYLEFPSGLILKLYLAKYTSNRCFLELYLARCTSERY